MRPFALENELLYGLLRKLIAAVPNPYRTDSSLAVDLPRNSCPSLPWKSCHFFAAKPSSENWKLLLLLLSLNLSISPRKNDFSFGLFPPLESLSDF
jgi:hypothetical protein